MNCALCGEHFNDGVQCSNCKKNLGFCCANITEAGYRKLGPERRAVWKCSQCKLSGCVSPVTLDVPPVPAVTAAVATASPSGPDSVSLSTIFQEILAIKKQLVDLPTLFADIKGIKSDIAELKLTTEFYGSTLDEHNGRISVLEDKIAGIKSLEETLSTALADIVGLKTEIADRDQRSRLNNLEIRGVPTRKNENLLTVAQNVGKAISCNLHSSDINYIARVPIHNSNEKSIVMTFHNRYHKEDFVAAARACKKLSTFDVLGAGDTSQRIYVNDHLTPQNKQLLTKTKAIAKEKEYQFVWVKYCKIHVRKNDSSRIIIIKKDGDLNKLP